MVTNALKSIYNLFRSQSWRYSLILHLEFLFFDERIDTSFGTDSLQQIRINLVPHQRSTLSLSSLLEVTRCLSNTSHKVMAFVVSRISHDDDGRDGMCAGDTLGMDTTLMPVKETNETIAHNDGDGQM